MECEIHSRTVDLTVLPSLDSTFRTPMFATNSTETVVKWIKSLKRSYFRISDQSVTLVVDSNSLSRGALPYPTKRKITWFYIAPSFRVAAGSPTLQWALAGMGHFPFTTQISEVCHKTPPRIIQSGRLAYWSKCPADSAQFYSSLRLLSPCIDC